MSTRKTNPTLKRIQSRRMNRRRAVQAGMAGAAGMAAAGIVSPAVASRRSSQFARQDPEPQRGGRLRIASTGQPAGLDMHIFNNRTVTLIAWNMYEALFTFDADYSTVPMLAEGIETSEDGLTSTIPLRQGVLFHNGEEMKAADVVASFERWMPVSSLGLAIQPYLESITTVDDYTVEIVLTSPLVALPSMLARQSQGLSIHPASVLEGAGSDPLPHESYIGTGPYQFVEMQADRFTLLERFDDYASVDREHSGYAGAKPAYLDELEFIPVPDEAARLAGLQSGEYHYLEEIIPDQIEVIGSDPNVTIEILPPRSYGVIIMNTVGGLTSDVTIRRAAQAAISVEELAQASHGAGYFEPGPGIMLPQTIWNSDVGREHYDQGDPEKCQQLLNEAGYDGKPVRILTTQEDLGDYNAAIVAQQQLEEGGFTVELEVFDEATLDEHLENDDRWEMTTDSYVFRPDPVLIAAFASCTATGKWCTDEKTTLMEQLQTLQDGEERFAAFENFQQLFYEQVPAIKITNQFGVAALAFDVRGLLNEMHFEIEPEFANAWLAQD
ncbi:MAG TPA: ABC transporter substrate-binding protein [Thermomicrobiales bacterium]|nr:ABC transporter substrate-binding protein [Thermomicrobiales bacterium]